MESEERSGWEASESGTQDLWARMEEQWRNVLRASTVLEYNMGQQQIFRRCRQARRLVSLTVTLASDVLRYLEA